MRLVLDEMISPVVAERLRSKGHDVVSAAEAGLQQAPDEHLFAWAVKDRRAIVTVNYEDFRPLHETSVSRGERHYGLVLIPRRHSLAMRAVGRLVTLLDSLLSDHPKEAALQSREHWLE